MQISVDQNHITVSKAGSIERYAIAHVRKTQKLVRHFTHKKDDTDIRKQIRFAIIGAIVLLIVSIYGFGLAILGFFVSAGAAIALYYKLNNDDQFKAKHTTLYWGKFISGNNEQYSLVSGNEKEIDEFLGAIAAAMSETISRTFNISIDNSVNSADLNIEKFINTAGSSVTFYEGEIPKEESLAYG